VLAKSKRPVPGGKGRSPKGVAARNSKRLPSLKPQQLESAAAKRAAAPTRQSTEAQDQRMTLVDDARKVLERSGWREAQQAELARACRALVAKLRETCPDLVVGRPLKPSEVAGEIAVNPEDFRRILTMAAGAANAPRTVWSDSTNELLVEIAKIAIKIEEGLVHVQIPVACEETGPQTIGVSFATGSEADPAGLIFSTDTAPRGPSEIVEIWGEALVALAWTSLLKSVTTLADVAGSDHDGAGLIPAGFAASGNGVKLLVMARHEMDRVVK
jgi:hypothetical protein